MRIEIKKDLAELPSILNEHIKNNQTIEHLTSFYSELPSSVELPSYFKMLVNDYRPSSKKL